MKRVNLTDILQVSERASGFCKICSATILNDKSWYSHFEGHGVYRLSRPDGKLVQKVRVLR